MPDPLHEFDRRPPDELNLEELKEWMSRNVLFKQTWNRIAPGLKARDIRGANKRNFALGYIYGLWNVRNQIETFDERVHKAIEKAVEAALKDIERTSHLGQID